MHAVYLSILVAVITYGCTVVDRIEVFAKNTEVPVSHYGATENTFVPGSMLFAGDIMLGRGVEDLIATFGQQYPYEHIAPFVQVHDIAVANFEASVPPLHKKTKSGDLRFSVSSEMVTGLREAGFDVLSLANNHAFDYGNAGFTHTRTIMEEAGVLSFGHPTNTPQYGSVVVNVGDTRVGLLGLHTLLNRTATATLSDTITELAKKSDVQFVFVHWGEEYNSHHDVQEEQLAHFLIDSGIDAIFGHHTHVIQDVEIYSGKPIFYSLGNLIFDQYFNAEVQTGYFVQVVFERDRARFEVIPYDSIDARSQPSIHIGDKRGVTVKKIFEGAHFSDDDRRSGVLYTSYDTRRP